MAKSKAKSEKVTNPHLRARVAFLHRAARLLASGQQNETSTTPVVKYNDTINLDDEDGRLKSGSLKGHQVIGIAQHLSSNARGVAMKSQIRLSKDVKHSLCKVCNSPLIEGDTSTSFKRNLSKNGKKPWADEFCVKCLVCGSVKKTSLSAPRQASKKKRLTIGDRGPAHPDSLNPTDERANEGAAVFKQ